MLEDPRTLDTGKEQYERYFSPILRKMVVQYDYRHDDGTLFSTVADDLETCRKKKEVWLSKLRMPA
jgi:hypothetical protein